MFCVELLDAPNLPTLLSLGYDTFGHRVARFMHAVNHLKERWCLVLNSCTRVFPKEGKA